LSFLDWAKALAQGSAEGVRQRKHLSEVEHFVLFIGHGRSGHSLVGSILNAHPNVVISHELGILAYAQRHFPRTALFGLIFRRDLVFESQDRQWGPYNFSVPSQYQGRVEHLRVIGDKRGAQTNRWITEFPDVLVRFRKTIGVPLRVVHVTRNPFDNIASLTKFGRSVDQVIDRFALRCDQTEIVRGMLRSEEIIDVRYESILADPVPKLAELCRFIGVEPVQSFLDDSAKVIWTSGSRPRSKVTWTPEEIDRVLRIIDAHPSYSGYTFED
jgi:hypothetical protein